MGNAAFFTDVTLKRRVHCKAWISNRGRPRSSGAPIRPCYHSPMFNFGQPKAAGDWIVHIAGAIIALFLVWWMLRVYVL